MLAEPIDIQGDQILTADLDRLPREARRHAAGQRPRRDADVLRPNADGDLGACSRGAIDRNRDREERRLQRSVVSAAREPGSEKDHPGIAEKPATEPVVGMVVELAGRRALDDLALFHERDLVGQRHRFGLIVSDIDDRLTQRSGQLLQGALELKLRGRIDVRDRLVKQDELRLSRHLARNRHFLAGAVVEFRDVEIGACGKSQQPDRVFDATRPLGAGQLHRLQRQLDVAVDADAAVDDRVLEDHADVALARREPGDILVAEIDRARGLRLETGDDPHQRRLATAGRPEETGDLPAGEGERNIIHRVQRAEGLGELLDANFRHGWADGSWSDSVLVVDGESR